jgi:hypothetical protein
MRKSLLLTTLKEFPVTRLFSFAPLAVGGPLVLAASGGSSTSSSSGAGSTPSYDGAKPSTSPSPAPRTPPTAQAKRPW